MTGEVNSRNQQPHSTQLLEDLHRLAQNCNQLILETAASVSTILGVRLPAHRQKIDDCNTTELRKYIAARDGKIQGNRAALLREAKAYEYMEKQVPKRYVDRNPNPNASMNSDEKAKEKTDNNMPKKKEYLVILELGYKPTCEMTDCHDLGIFEVLKRSYCTACVAGQADCRHKAERLWYQYHHWTEERLGIDKPPTLDACSWSAGGTALCCDVEKPLHSQQTVSLERTLDKQIAKIQRGIKRNCTEGHSAEYQVHRCTRKQKPTGRFDAAARPVVGDFFAEYYGG
ncbi:hypothetical protein ACHAXR_008146 [Thalassiosira sp. AJA248-18]